jgi:crotonobetainyl-CoA:carnitine CoA-transferase CaiB-like acyl-CoA transferase
MAMAGGIAAALVKRERTGEGSVVDVALLNVAMWQLGPDITSAKLYEGMAVPRIDRDALPNPLTGTYRTRDERHITLMMLQSDPYWEDFCQHIGRPDLASHPRFCDSKVRTENSRELMALLREVFAQRSFRQWCETLDTLQGVWAPVMTPLEVHDDPQVKANGYLRRIVTNSGATLDIPANPVQFDELPPSVRGAPELGAQTEEVLLEMGLSFDAILDLKRRGAVL